MSRRRAGILAWSLFGLFQVINVATVTLALADRGGDEYLTAIAFGYPLVGAIVASHQPRNAVGWLLLAIGALVALGGFVDTNLRSASAPALPLSAWISEWVWFAWLVCAGCFLPLVFPNGRLLSRRWRPVLWLAGLGLLISVLGTTLEPGPFDETDSPRPIENPVGIEGAGGFLSVLNQAGVVLQVIAFVAAAASLVIRFRRSRGAERQQFKLFAYAAMVAIAGLGLAVLSTLFGAEEGKPADSWMDVVGNIGWFTALFTILIGIPVATGLAILRHRLYDIDVVINRTLVYGALTITLLAAYLGLVLLLQLVLSPLTEESDLAIAASTLAVAALFRPVRGRVQELVDRRFYRRKYDAAHEVEAFSARLRDEVELDALSSELGAVVRDTMQPAHVSLWLRGAG